MSRSEDGPDPLSPHAPLRHSLWGAASAIRRWVEHGHRQLKPWHQTRLGSWVLSVPILGQRGLRTIFEQRYRKQFERAPRLDAPQLFTEIVTHRIVYDRDPLLKTVSDKIAVRRLIAQTVGERYAVPLLGAWKRAADIEWDRLPNAFVLKPNHSSGPYRIVHNKAKADRGAIATQADDWLQHDYFDRSREWGYQGLPRRITAEPLLRTPEAPALMEASAFTLSGEPAVVLVTIGKKRSRQWAAAWFDSQGRRLDLNNATPPVEVIYSAEDAACFHQLAALHIQDIVRLSATIGRHFSLIRVDFYLTGRGLKIGELTPYPGGGMGAYRPSEWDERLGQMFVQALSRRSPPRLRGRARWPNWPEARAQTLVALQAESVRCAGQTLRQPEELQIEEFARASWRRSITRCLSAARAVIDPRLAHLKRGLSTWLHQLETRADTFVDTWRQGLLRPWVLRLPALGRRKIKRILIGRFRKALRHSPNLVAPGTFNEIVTHRILHDRDPRLKLVCDKLAVRDLISRVAGPGYVVPMIGKWRNAADIPWDRLPKTFVLKPSHLSGPYRVVGSRNQAGRKRLEQDAASWLRRDYFDQSNEWGYRGVPRWLIAEPLLMGPCGGPLIEVNAMTFSGSPAVLQVMTGRKATPQRCNVWYDHDGRRLDLKGTVAAAESTLDEARWMDLQTQFERHRAEIVEIAGTLGAQFSFIRVDIWITQTGLRVGELTPYPGGGRSLAYKPAGWDERLGQMFLDGLAANPAVRARSEWPPAFPERVRRPSGS